MSHTAQPTLTRTVFHLAIGDDHTLVLPPELREQLGLEAGDVVAISVFGGGASFYKASRAKAADPVTTEAVPEARGLLRDDFADREDVRRFLEAERGG